MPNKHDLLLICLLLVLGSAPAARADDRPTPDQNRHTVSRGTVKIERILSGLLVPSAMEEVMVRTEVWNAPVVESVVGHGIPVRKGDVVLQLETDNLKKAIRDKELVVAQLEKDLERAGLDLDLTRQSMTFALADARRNRDLAAEDLRLFEEVDRPLEEMKTRVKALDSRNQLAYQEEELRQLTRMYEEDQLTDETEEIILRRQRDTVERHKSAVEEWRVFEKRQQEVDLPRRARTLAIAKDKQDFEVRRLDSLQPVDLARKQVELEQTRLRLANEQQTLEQHRRDLDAMTLRAPMDGVVYHGRFLRTDWTMTDAEKCLFRGGNPPRNVPLLTIVPAETRQAEVWLKEADLHLVDALTSGSLRPASDPSLHLQARVDRVSAFPRQKGWFQICLTVTNLPENASLLPGVTCTFRFLPYLRENAVIVPSDMVLTDDADPSRRFVYRADAAGRAVRHEVKVGCEENNVTEILEGLNPGEVVLKKPDPGDLSAVEEKQDPAAPALAVPPVSDKKEEINPEG